jgi:hypothetical protein
MSTSYLTQAELERLVSQFGLLLTIISVDEYRVSLANNENRLAIVKGDRPLAIFQGDFDRCSDFVRGYGAALRGIGKHPELEG